MTTMSPRERFACSMSWQDPDRPLVHGYFTPEIRQQLVDHFGRPVEEALEFDFRGVGPRYRGPIRAPEGDLTYDIWGAGYRQISNPAQGTYSEAAYLPLAKLETMDDVAAYPWPNADDYDCADVPARCAAVGRFVIQTGGAGIPDILNGVSRARGMEQVMIDIATRDEVGLAIIDKRCDHYYTMLERTLEAAAGRIDVVCLGEDCGNQLGRMFSPRDFNEVFRPRLQRFYDLAHRYDARAMMHSCGDTHEIMDTFVAMGLDILDAMQPEPAGMDPETIRAKCRGRLAFCGLVSTQQTLPHGTVADCRAEARHRLDVIAPGGGYIFAPAHCIQPDTPLANVLAIYEEALGHPL